VRERVLLVIYGLLLAEFVLLLVSSAAFLCLLRWRHANVWRSLGSPWFSYMQSFLKPATRKLTGYLRDRGYLELTDPLSRDIGGLMRLHMRLGPWVIITLSAAALIVMWTSRFSQVS
jgi:hypothetical protein